METCKTKTQRYLGSWLVGNIGFNQALLDFRGHVFHDKLTCMILYLVTFEPNMHF